MTLLTEVCLRGILSLALRSELNLTPSLQPLGFLTVFDLVIVLLQVFRYLPYQTICENLLIGGRRPRPQQKSGGPSRAIPLLHSPDIEVLETAVLLLPSKAVRRHPSTLTFLSSDGLQSLPRCLLSDRNRPESMSL
jgi:hypothetical protein